MLRFLISLILITVGLSPAEAKDKKPVRVAVSGLFDHKKHSKAFAGSVSCTDCHSFSVKTNTGDPLSLSVPKGFLKPDNRVCHLCHLHSLKQPTPNQCILCHTYTREIMPESHKLNWGFRHGRMAQSAPETCKECHQESTCGKCHTQRDALKPMVHRPNFRLTHGIEARSRPESCASCHSTTNTCTKCHSTGAP